MYKLIALSATAIILSGCMQPYAKTQAPSRIVMPQPQVEAQPPASERQATTKRTVQRSTSPSHITPTKTVKTASVPVTPKPVPEPEYVIPRLEKVSADSVSTQPVNIEIQ